MHEYQCHVAASVRCYLSIYLSPPLLDSLRFHGSSQKLIRAINSFLPSLRFRSVVRPLRSDSILCHSSEDPLIGFDLIFFFRTCQFSSTLIRVARSDLLNRIVQELRFGSALFNDWLVEFVQIRIDFCGRDLISNTLTMISYLWGYTL